jgi:hypothetical protein
MNDLSKNYHVSRLCKKYTKSSNIYFKSNMDVIQHHIDIMRDAGGIDWYSVYNVCVRFVDACIRDYLSNLKRGSSSFYSYDLDGDIWWPPKVMDYFSKEEQNAMAQNLVEHFRSKEKL